MDDFIAKSEDGEEEEGCRYEKDSDLQSCDSLSSKDKVKVFLSDITCKFCPFQNSKEYELKVNNL
jgi:hypothetical protein